MAALLQPGTNRFLISWHEDCGPNALYEAGCAGSVQEMFQRKQRNAQGEETQAYEINEEVMAMLDYYLSCSLSALLSNAREHIEFYGVRVALYKKMDGKDGNPNWRESVEKELDAYLQLFPHVAGRKKRSSSSKNTMSVKTMDDLAEEEL